ncbi:uncharacterized protein LOC132904442 [Amyelois transitella]|uniref:uncharacterized protein LOC132904442 n=1 Tax=Amyelois transitella TaxID=680683 RepID=UPI00298FE203|nr:uncharacterized protein LOC132904442 [Amyelois transitella]
MNRDFVFNHQQDRPSTWSRAGSTLNRWLWGALCCGVPGIPCYFCNCCERLDDTTIERDRSRINQSTATAERMARPHRPHAPCGRKSTPEMLSAVRCALSQLQGEPAPPLPVSSGEKRYMPDPG